MKTKENKALYYNKGSVAVIMLSLLAICMVLFFLGYGIASSTTEREPDTRQPLVLQGKYCFRNLKQDEEPPYVYVSIQDLDGTLVYRRHGLAVEDQAPVRKAKLQCGELTTIPLATVFSRYGTVYVYEKHIYDYDVMTEVISFDLEKENSPSSQANQPSGDLDAGTTAKEDAGSNTTD